MNKVSIRLRDSTTIYFRPGVFAPVLSFSCLQDKYKQ